MQIHEWIADRILENVSEENHADFLEALQNKREKLIAFYYPHMEQQMMSFMMSGEESSEAVVVNADSGDVDCWYTLSKKAVDHLRGSLLEDVEVK